PGNAGGGHEQVFFRVDDQRAQVQDTRVENVVHQIAVRGYLGKAALPPVIGLLDLLLGRDVLLAYDGHPAQRHDDLDVDLPGLIRGDVEAENGGIPEYLGAWLKVEFRAPYDVIQAFVPEDDVLAFLALD